MSSPGFAFVRDIVGANAVNTRRAGRAGGIRVRGRDLIVDLRQPVPDFLQRIALPFFCATASSVPLKEGGVTVLPAAGPYYVADRRLNKSLVVRRNRFYRGPRPHHVDAIVYTVQENEEDSLEHVSTGRADWAAGLLPRTAYASLAKRYGITRGRFRVNPTLGLVYLALNTARPPFSDVHVRRAVNYAVDRRVLAQLRGRYAATPTDELLPSAVRGPSDAKLYPLFADADSLAEARRLSRGRLGDGKVRMRSLSCYLCGAVHDQLAKMGLDVMASAAGCLECPVDLAVAESTTPYPDGGAFLSDTLDVTRWRMASPRAALAKVRRLSGLRGQRRTRAYRHLAIGLAKMDAPVVPLYVPRDRNFFSARVGCVTYQPVYGIDLAALCLR